MNLLRSYNPKVYDALQAHKVVRDEDMPYAYQFANPQGHPRRNDLGLMVDNPNSFLAKIQPWQDIPRMEFFYTPPLPFRIKVGKKDEIKQIIDPSYPLAPGTSIFYEDVYTAGGKFRLPHVMVDQAGDGFTQWEGYLGGQWVDCFWRYHKSVLGKRFSSYSGARPDYAVGFNSDWTIRPDTGVWFPDVSASWVKEQ